MSTIEIAKKIQTTPAPEFTDDVIIVVDLFDGLVGPIKGASNFVDFHLMFYRDLYPILMIFMTLHLWI